MFTRHRRLIMVIAAALLSAGAATLAGCGQTGPLYLPKPEAKPAQAVPATATATAAQSASIPLAARR